MKRRTMQPVVYFTENGLKEIIAFLNAYDYILENRLKIKNNKRLKLWIDYLSEEYKKITKL